MSDATSNPPSITLVIPGRDCAGTLSHCLESVIPRAESGELSQIIFVDDGSTDDSRSIAQNLLSGRLDHARFQILAGGGDGPGAARNLGWRAADDADLIWFIDSDCVAEPDALQTLLPHLDDPDVAGSGGSYGNLYPDSLLATLIHEEIVARHRRMPPDVNFLATFNVLYRRQVLDEVDGFDEALKLAQDADLAFRIHSAGWKLRFEIASRVGHHHPRRLWRYLRTQFCTSRFRIHLYRRHPGRAKGDSYAGLIDYAQPPLALITVPALALSVTFGQPLWGAVPLFLLLLLQIPMTSRMLRALYFRAAAFPVLGMVRAFFRGCGMVQGLIEDIFSRTSKEQKASSCALEASAVSSEKGPS